MELRDATADPLRKAIANFINTITSGLEIIFLIALVLFAVYVFTDHDKADHTCDAPCTVNFNSGMAEDMFWIDYKGAKDHKGTVRVYCSETDNRFREVACP